jgi:drug/metabolite transporter (DMT)-like permease
MGRISAARLISRSDAGARPQGKDRDMPFLTETQRRQTSRRRVSNRLLPSLIGAVGVMLWATETTLITFTTAIPPLQTVALAFVFATMLSPLAWALTGASPAAAFSQPPRVWFIVVGALVGYHAVIYYATQQAPPAAAALLQGTTPLMIVLASGLLPGERLCWWHVAGAVMGMAGVVLLIDTGGETPGDWLDARFYLSLIGVAAALWGLYAIVSRARPDVPTSALGIFYAAAALVCLTAHAGLETWVAPSLSEWAAIAGLGILPMGLAIYFWDHGIKRGDIQALGAFAYVEPFIGATLVTLFSAGMLDVSLLIPGLLVIGGAVFASASLWGSAKTEVSILEASARGTGDIILGDRASTDCRPTFCDASHRSQSAHGSPTMRAVLPGHTERGCRS